MGDASLSDGATVSHYRIVEKIGAGGMGEVYRATDTELDRTVAIKILPPAFASDPQRLKRFVQEAKAASALNHPHILTIHEIGRTETMRFIATEFIDGETLRQRMRATNLKLSEVLGVAIQVAGALAAAHEAGIVHRDIKPENIMIRRSDKIVKVLDFGLAKVAERKFDTAGSASTTTAFATEPGAVMGTIFYLSPEQARGLEVDARSDIWSLGVVIYEMAAGCLPFEGSTSGEALASILSDKEQQPIARYSRDTPAELERIVSKALRKIREERYQTVKDLVLDLQALKQQLEIDAKLERITSSNQNAGPAISVSSIAKRRKFSVLAAALIVAAVAALGFYWRATPADAAIDSIAILPFANDSRDPEMEYLSDGVSENIINSLGQLPSLRVIAWSSVSRYKGPEIDPMAIAKKLGVRAVLTGHILQRGDTLTVNVNLEDVRNNTPIWGDQYSKTKTDLLFVQREIAREISRKLERKLSGAEQRLVAKQYTADEEAYRLYMLGLFHWRMRGENLLKAIDYFTQATIKDPNYALAYSGLADSYNLLSNYSVKSPEEAFPNAIKAARKALELDDTLAEAHASLARALFSYDWNVAESDREYLRAIALKPNYATAHQWYSRGNLTLTGRFDEAKAEMTLARNLDPLSLIMNADLSYPYLHARQYEKAIEQSNKTVELAAELKQPDIYYTHIYLGIAYEMKFSYQSALDEYQKARSLSRGRDPYVLGLLGHAYASSGQKREALEMVEQLKDAKGYVSPYYFAIVYAALDDRDKAFYWLERSYDEHDVQMTGLKLDPLLENFRSDKRFMNLVEKVGIR